MSKKEIKLTNWQVPKNPDPKTQVFEAYKSAPAFNPDNHKDLGKVHHNSEAEVIAKMIAAKEAARGQKINQEAPKETLSLGGVKDDRPNKKYIKLYTKG